MANAPHFPRRSHRPKAFNFLTISDEVKAQRAAMLEAKRLADEAAQAKERTAAARAALEAEENRKAEKKAALAAAENQEHEISAALLAISKPADKPVQRSSSK
jgi:hypothetical protein